MEQNITFTLLKSLAMYVAALVPTYTSIVVAIAKASAGKQLDELIDVTISEADVVVIFNQLTVQPEGVAAVNNNELEDILTPLLATRPALAEAIIAIKQSNEDQRAELVTRGEIIVGKLQQAIANN